MEPSGIKNFLIAFSRVSRLAVSNDIDCQNIIFIRKIHKLRPEHIVVHKGGVEEKDPLGLGKLAGLFWGI